MDRQSDREWSGEDSVRTDGFCRRSEDRTKVRISTSARRKAFPGASDSPMPPNKLERCEAGGCGGREGGPRGRVCHPRGWKLSEVLDTC